jgi:hypothetical protein
MPTYTSQYPPAQNGTYVKATSQFHVSLTYPYFATDPTKSLTGTYASNLWYSQNTKYTNQRFHIDLGSSMVIKRVYYENAHNSSLTTNRGAKNFTLWGSDSADDFADLVYANDGTWSQITTSVSSLDRHVDLDQADPKYFTLTNSVAYRYWAFKFADNWGGTDMLGIRRVVLQTEDFSGGFMSCNKGWL